MKLFKNLIAYSLLSLLILIGCDKNDDINTPLNNSVNKFVWKGMNSWYNWQPEVQNLADSKDNNGDSFYSFLNSYSSSEELFYNLCYKHTALVGKDNDVDRFSWFIDDYVEQQKQFQGISTSYGLRLRAVEINNSTGEIILFVRYVTNDSPAFNAGIKRGDIINAINGTVLNASNYNSVIGDLSNDSVTLSFVSESGGVLTPIEDKSITRAEISDNPVYLTKVFNDIGGNKVGYLVYNSFRSSYNDELNAAFATLVGEGIDELVLDLRINGGGSVSTSAYLASMINASAGIETFAELRFNSKHTDRNGTYDFDNTLNVYDVTGNKTGTETINRLSTLSRLYVLTSDSTASASEMIINGLKPYFEVIVVGTTTYGKNVGSITLYDSPSSDYLNPETANTSHLNAMQPIVFQIYNKNGESDYLNGFAPDIEVVEYDYWNNILPLGDENEVVLKAALDDIRGVSTRISSFKKLKQQKLKTFEVLEFKFEKEMFIENNFFQKE